MVEADVAVVVADLVVVEGHGAAVFGVAVDAHARLFRGAVPREMEVVDDDDRAVEQLLLPVGGADAQAVTDGDFERGMVAPVLPVADRYDVGVAGFVAECVAPQCEGQGAALGVGAGQDGDALVRVFVRIAGDVVREFLDGRVHVAAQVKAAAVAVCGDRFSGVAVPENPRMR